MNKKLQDKVALITGSDSGIGRGIVEAFAEEGATVVITYHSDKDSATALGQIMQENGYPHAVYQVDVGDEKLVADLFENIKNKFGKIDILVNNAAVNGSEIAVQDMETEVFDRCIKTNLYGPFFCSRAFLKHWTPNQQNGRIINVSSIHEDVVTAGNADYNASKGGLKNFARSLALELAEKNITVNNIAPGMILTDMNKAAMDDDAVRKEKEQHIPMKRAGIVDDIKAAAVYLASKDSSYVTGATIFIDGGLSLNLGQGA